MFCKIGNGFVFRLFLLVLISFNLFAHSKEVLQEKLFAVHATEILPADGILRSGFGDLRHKLKDDQEHLHDLIQKTRQTIHFSLGELVRPVGNWENWEGAKYAIIVPVKDLMGQLINLNCADCFVLGDFELEKRTILVAPKGTKVNGNLYELFEYEGRSLREMVDFVIAKKGGWKVRMTTGIDEDVLKKAICKGKNINTKAFFKPLLDGIPYLSVGLRFDPLDGDNYRLSEIEASIISVLCYFFGLDFSDKSTDLSMDVKWTRNETRRVWKDLKSNFRLWKERVGDLVKNKRAVRDLNEVVTVCLNLLEYQLYLDKKGDSIQKKSYERVTQNWTDLESLKESI